MSFEQIDKQPEAALLGCLLIDGERVAQVAEIVRAEDFEEPTHRAIFEAIQGLVERKAPIDFVTVGAELKAKDRGAHSDTQYLVELGQAVTSSSHAVHLAKLVAERAFRRRVSLMLADESKKIQETGVGQGLVYEAVERLRANLPDPKVAGVSLGSIETVCLVDVESRPVSWLWPGRVALRKVTLLAGDPGLGKSTLTLDIAARVSRGALWPDVAVASPVGRVLIATAEDALDDTIRPRLEAAGARLENIHAIQFVKTRSGERAFSLADDLPALEREIVKREGLRLLVIDPVTAFLGATDSHKNSEVRAVLAPLSTLAEKHGIAVIAITHLNKAQQSPAVYRSLGSIGFVATARAAWFVAKDPQDPSRRLMLEAKNNLGQASGLAFRVDSAPGPEETSVPVIAWEEDPVTVGLDEALAPAESGSKSELERARDFLLSELSSGSLPATEIQQGARANGIAEKTLNRAKKDLRVVARKGDFSRGGWTWSLPEDGQARDLHEMTTFGGNGHLRSDEPEKGDSAPPPARESPQGGHQGSLAIFAAQGGSREVRDPECSGAVSDLETGQ